MFSIYSFLFVTHNNINTFLNKRVYKNVLYLFIFFFSLLLNSCKENTPTDNYVPPRIWEPIDFRVIDNEPSWSKDGKWIAYVHGDTIAATTGIYIIDTNGNNKRLIISSARAYTPDFSPDGNWIVFSMNAQIYKIKVNGDSLIQLTSEGRNFFCSWSPDGEWIVYDSDKDNVGYRIWKMRKDGIEKTLMIGGRIPIWGLDNFIYYLGFYGEIFKINAFNYDETFQVTHYNEIDIYANYLYYLNYSYSVNKIAVTIQPKKIDTSTLI